MIAHWDDVEGRLQELGHLRATWYDLGSAAGSRTVGVTRLRMDEGGIPTPAHVHQDEEEIFFVLAGSGLSWQDGKTYEVRGGDTIVHRVFQEAHTLRAGPDGLDVLAFGQRGRGVSAVLPRAGVMWAWPSWVEVGKGDRPWAREAAAGPPEFPPPETERPETIRAREETEMITNEREGHRARARRLAPPPIAESTGLNFVQLEPGQMGPPPHCHSAEEELFVVLDGGGVVVLGEEEHELRRGHVVARPPATRVAHAFRAGDAGLTYLAYGTREPNDICFYPRSNKIAWRGVGVIGRVEQLDYWDGED
ncbi:MAG: cupin domain-containing protein [Gaiellaceae bacterium]